MERGEDGEERGQRVGLLLARGGRGTLVEERYAEAEVGEGGGGERFDEDVDHDVRVIEIWVELVPARRARRPGCSQGGFVCQGTAGLYGLPG